jgi:hypothetical protein
LKRHRHNRESTEPGSPHAMHSYPLKEPGMEGARFNYKVTWCCLFPFLCAQTMDPGSEELDRPQAMHSYPLKELGMEGARFSYKVTWCRLFPFHCAQTMDPESVDRPVKDTEA